MALAAGSILRRYVAYALTAPSTVVRDEFPDIRFRPSYASAGGIYAERVPDGTFAFAVLGEPVSVGDMAIDGSGRPVYDTATGAVAVRVNMAGDNRDSAFDTAMTYAQATRRALRSGRYWGFVDDSGGTLALNHFELVGDSTVQETPSTGENGAPFYLVITRYRGTARPA